MCALLPFKKNKNKMRAPTSSAIYATADRYRQIENSRRTSTHHVNLKVEYVMCPMVTPRTEEEVLKECRENFCRAATFQGRVAYLLMSLHAVNPGICARFTTYDPTHLLFSNMVYGMSVHLFSRPSMSLVGVLHRVTFSVLGSMMFNYSVMQVYEWLGKSLPDRPYLLTFLGWFSGRIMLVHMLAYLYHVDTRSILSPMLGRDVAYETMYG